MKTLLLLCIFTCGCGSVYSQSPSQALAPDSFSLFSSHAEDGEWTGGFGGFSWDLK